MMFGRVVCIRDKQLIENEQLEKDYLEEQRRIEHMMEINRVKGLKEEEEREVELIHRKKAGQNVLVDQIAENNYRRGVLDYEEKQRERMAILKKVDQIRQEDMQKKNQR